jgi:hypothetical protein
MYSIVTMYLASIGSLCPLTSIQIGGIHPNMNHTNRINPRTSRFAVFTALSIGLAGLTAGCSGEGTNDGPSAGPVDQPQACQGINDLDPVDNEHGVPITAGGSCGGGRVCQQDPATGVFGCVAADAGAFTPDGGTH